MLLEQELKELQDLRVHLESQKTSVSDKNVAWHIDHSLKVIIAVCKTLQKSNPDDYQSDFNFLRIVVLLTEKIPRGKGKAPKRTLPPEIIEEKALNVQFQYAEKMLQEIEKLPAKSFMKHPVFGMLPLKNAIKFLKIHTNHHVKIINDIIK